jgi:hypothetical protein
MEVVVESSRKRKREELEEYDKCYLLNSIPEGIRSWMWMTLFRIANKNCQIIVNLRPTFFLCGVSSHFSVCSHGDEITLH